jgi:SAM-dependent methyltransferase
MDVDFSKTAHDYGRYRMGFPPEAFERLAAFGIGQPGQRVLDLGAGTGTLARNLALRGCRVVALDVAAAQLEQAKLLDQEAGVRVDYRVAPAEATGLPSASFDVVTAGQCWHWFDRPRAAAEIQRVLAPGGCLVIAYLDWLPMRGNVVEATETLIVRHNPWWTYIGGVGIHPEWVHDVAEAGFRQIETFSFDVDLLYSHEAWRGRVRASAPISATLAPAQVAAFDSEFRELLARDFPEDPMPIPHRVFAILCRSPYP